MSDAVALPLALALLTATLAVALLRPARLPESAIAVASAPLLIAVEWGVISRWSGAGRAAASGQRRDGAGAAAHERPAIPRFALAVLALTLAGFALTSAIGIDPLWVAVAGAAVINLPAPARRRAGVAALVRGAEPGFLLFVLALGVIVAAASHHGLAGAVRDVLSAGASLPDLLAIAAVSGVLANLVNNLPATLILATMLLWLALRL